VAVQPNVTRGIVGRVELLDWKNLASLYAFAVDNPTAVTINYNGQLMVTDNGVAQQVIKI
jgi:hypothetical protein